MPTNVPRPTGQGWLKTVFYRKNPENLFVLKKTSFFHQARVTKMTGKGQKQVKTCEKTPVWGVTMDVIKTGFVIKTFFLFKNVF